MNSSIFAEWKVETDFKNTRIDYYLKKKFKSLSYPYVCTLLRKGLVKVNGKKVKNTYHLCLDDIIRINKNFNSKSNDQKRLNSLNIIPLGGVAMALSFFISVRLLGQADSNIVNISIFALAISILGVVDDFLNLNWKMKIVFQFLFISFP